MSKTPRDTQPRTIRPPYPHPSGIRPPEIPRELVPKHVAAFGDITFEVGFVIAALLYVILFQFQPDRDAEEAAVIG